MSSTHEGISIAANQEMKNIVRKLSSHFEFDFNDAMNVLQKVPLKKEMQDTTKYDEKLIVLEPCNPNEIGINYDKAKEYLDGYFTPIKMEYLKSTSTNNLILDDGFMEFLTAKCIGGQHIGAGNCAIDVLKD